MTTTTTPMAGAELKVRLQGLGLPPTWFAERLGVTMRTVVRWFDGEDVSPVVADELEKLSDLAVDEMRKMLDKVGWTDGDADVTLVTYRTDKSVPASRGKAPKMPASWHRALTFRVMEHLRAQGATVHIEYK